MISDKEYLEHYFEEKCEAADAAIQARLAIDKVFYMLEALDKVYSRAKFLLDNHDVMLETCRLCSIECTCADLLDHAIEFVDELKRGELNNVIS